MENRLKRKGYVEIIVENNDTYYQITSKGKEIFEKYFKDFEKINETMVNISKKELS